MKHTVLGNSGLQVSALGLGCMGMSHGYGTPASRKEMEQLIAEAVEMGYTLFDTAETYGTIDDPHDNEHLVGDALRPYRNRVVIVTKCGVHHDMSVGKAPYPIVVDSSREAIRRSVEGSLRRLHTDHIDLYFQHRIDPHVAPEEVAYTMGCLKRDGKILHWGISEANEDYLRRAHKVEPVACIQNRFSMMARWYEPLLPVCKELGIGFMAFSPLANGLLTDRYSAANQFDPVTDYRASMPQFQAESFADNAELLRLVRSLAEKHKATPAQISLAWMMCKEPAIVPIPGTRKAERLRENAGAADITLSPVEVLGIDRALDRMKVSDVFGGTKIKQ